MCAKGERSKDAAGKLMMYNENMAWSRSFSTLNWPERSEDGTDKPMIKEMNSSWRALAARSCPCDAALVFAKPRLYDGRA
jgi:hypothetical protein